MDALVVIDMQKWMFRYKTRAEQLPSLLTNIKRLLAHFDRERLLICDVRTEHKADRSTRSRLMLKHDYPCLVEGSTDAESVEGYFPPQSSITVAKTANSAFVGTTFGEALETRGVDRLFLAGVFLDGCVGLTAADAEQRGLETILVADAIGHRSMEHRKAVLDWLVSMYEIRVLDTEEVWRDTRLAKE